MYPYHYHSSRRRNGRYSGVSCLVIFPYFAGIMAMTILLGSCQMALRKKDIEERNPATGFTEEDIEVKQFLPGEHIISVLIDSPLEEAQQYEYHPGYKPVGIASATYGKSNSIDAGSCMLYVNEYPVEAKSTGIKDEQPFFGEFGTPIDYIKTELTERDDVIEFAPGEHIFSIPIDDPTDFNFQYDFHEGYEPIGITTASYGQSMDFTAGSCILYVNTETVECEVKENNKKLIK